MSKLEQAIKFAVMQFKVFPLQNNTKDGQVLKSWKNEATCDLEQIKKWWDKDRDYNLAIRTGSGLVVIDVDVKNGKDGRIIFNEYSKSFPETFAVKTPNGGYHYWYLVDSDIPCKVNLYEGIDIRGEGGYILSPPSIVDSIEYVVIKDVPIAKANDEIYEFLKIKPKDTSRKKTVEVICTGERNDTLFKEACSLQSGGFSDEAIQACILKENEMRCSPSLSEREVMTIVESVLTRYPKGKMKRFSLNKDEIYNGYELMNMQMNHIPNIVQDIFSVGVNVFGAPQKIGKTFFCLQLANCIASGQTFLEKDVQQGYVHYIALEDLKENFQKRLRNFNIDISSNLGFQFSQAYDKNFDAERIIIEQKQCHPDLKFMIIDTFAKVRNLRNMCKQDKYDYEYKELSYYHELGYKYGIGILLVTHVTKKFDRDNPFDCIYGSRGVTAAADGLLVMQRASVTTNLKEIFISGKDIPFDNVVLEQNANLLYSLTEQETEMTPADKDMIAVLLYVVKIGKYEGTISKLCAIVGVGIKPNQLSAMFKKYKNVMDEYFVRFEQLKKTSAERPIRLTYYGETDE